MTIGESLKRFRKEMGLNQRQVATNLEIPYQSYQGYEYDRNVPSANVIIKLATIFNVSTDYLLGLSDVPNPSKIETATPIEVDDAESNALTIAAENDRILDYHENLAHVLAKQGIKI